MDDAERYGKTQVEAFIEANNSRGTETTVVYQELGDNTEEQRSHSKKKHTADDAADEELAGRGASSVERLWRHTRVFAPEVQVPPKTILRKMQNLWSLGKFGICGCGRVARSALDEMSRPPLSTFNF